MNPFYNISIRTKLTLIIFITAASVNVIGLGIDLFLDAQQAKNQIEQELIIDSKIIAEALVPTIAFDQPESAKDILESLENLTDFISGIIYDKNGEIFTAIYNVDNEYSRIKLSDIDEGSNFIGDQLHVLTKIKYQNIIYGYLLLSIKTNELEKSFLEHLWMSIIIACIVLVVAFFAAKKIQRNITGPLVHLSQTTSKISHSKDYSVRLKTTRNDEIGELYNGFNNMLEQIEMRNSEREKAKNEAIKNERHFRALFEESPIPLWEEDFSEVKRDIDQLKKNGIANFREYFENNLNKVNQLARAVKILRFNKAALTLHKAKSRSDLEKGLAKIFTKESLPTIIEELVSIAEGRTQCELEGIVQTIDGKKIIVNVNWLVVPGYEETMERVYVSTIDISERKRVEQDLIRAKNDAEKADRLKSTFLAQMSHEIRTPINAMLSLSSLVQYDLKEKVNKEQKVSFDLINKAGNRIVRTVDLLLNLSEIQAGSYEPIMKRFDLYSDILGKIILEHKKDAQEKEINLKLKLETDNSELVADTYTVYQIFEQLLDNAIKYTNRGRVEVKVFRLSKHLVVDVVDTGIGISEEFLPDLFNAFSQEDTGYTRKYDGNGIGLALVKNYCNINNAEIEVESNKNVGSTFRIIFN